MNKISGETKTIFNLLGEEGRGFLVPEYQRQYSWTERECERLWGDLWDFAFPRGNPDEYIEDKGRPYFLGSVVMFVNEADDGRMEIIDGQQRITTLLLLLRAFYSRLGDGKDDATRGFKQNIERCFWRTDKMMNTVCGDMKLLSKVATDDKISEFNGIINTGVAPANSKSNYAVNFRYFQQMVDAINPPGYFDIFLRRILTCCVLLPITTDCREAALRVFTTLNDRGLPLSDADMFKSVLYRIYDDDGKRDYFVSAWSALEDNCGKAFPKSKSPATEIFTQYMHIQRAKAGVSDTTTKGVRVYYAENGYSSFDMAFFEDIKALSSFWRSVGDRSPTDFSPEIQRRLFVLGFAPNAMWTYLVSAWFCANAEAGGIGADRWEVFDAFLRKITAFIWAYTILTPGTNQLRAPVYSELIKIVRGRPCDFSEYLFDERKLSLAIDAFSFSNSRPITRAMLAWWAMHNPSQAVPPRSTTFHVEHIYSVKRNELHPLSSPDLVDSLGNKSLLEGDINIPASAYPLADKKAYYNGRCGGCRKTCINELLAIAEKGDFAEKDIMERSGKIRDEFLEELRELGLLMKI